MVFAVETYCPASDGISAARIEEEVILTPEGAKIILALSRRRAADRKIHTEAKGASSRHELHPRGTSDASEPRDPPGDASAPVPAGRSRSATARSAPTIFSCRTW